MARRRIVEDPVSRLAIWARRLALFSLTVVFLAIVVARSGRLDIIPVLVTFAAGLVLAVGSILLAFAAFVVIWRLGLRGFGSAVAALAIGVLLLAYPGYVVLKGYRLPRVADVTSDPADPPRFEAIALLRTRQANPPGYTGLAAADQARSPYSDIETLELAVPPARAYAAVHVALTKRKDNAVAPLWRIIDDRIPIPRQRDGHIEAVAYTSIFGFRDDVVVRIRPAAAGGSRVDVRSASRYGKWDFGVNGKRARRLLEDIDSAVDSLKPEVPVAAEPPARGKTQRNRR